MSKFKKVMNIVNIDGENLHIFWTSWEISMKYSGKMWFMMILKFTKNKGFALSLEDTFLEKPQQGGMKLTPSSLGLKYASSIYYEKLDKIFDGTRYLIMFKSKISYLYFH